MDKILFICEGNVGRSQIAEGFYNKYSTKSSALSAGVKNVGAKYDYKPRDDVIRVMKEKGVDISKARIKLINASIINKSTKIVVLCNPKIVPDIIFNSGKDISYFNIKDPYTSSIEELRSIRDTIENIVLSLIKSD